MKKLFYILLLSVTAFQPICAQKNDVTVTSKGEYAKIDVKSQNETIEALNSDDNNVRNKAMDAVVVHPHDYNPTVLFAYSKILFDRDKKDDAAFWFYVAQLRARYDANLCLDKSAKGAASELSNIYGPEINQYAAEDLTKLEATIAKVIAFVKGNEEKYDHRWINLHGMGAMINGMDDKAEIQEMTEPKSKWAKIKTKTIADYEEGFQGFLKQLKKS